MDEPVLVTQADVDEARRIVLDAMATDLLSGDRRVVKADRYTVYKWLGRVQGLLVGTVAAAPPAAPQEPNPDSVHLTLPGGSTRADRETHEREAFEAWARGRGLNVDKTEYGYYYTDTTHAASLAWQAALASPSSSGVAAAGRTDETEKLQRERDGLLEALRRMDRAYMNLMENGRDRILFLGGQCDSLEQMEASDPNLRDARAALAAVGGEPK